jgi:hypothetical protein
MPEPEYFFQVWFKKLRGQFLGPLIKLIITILFFLQ